MNDTIQQILVALVPSIITAILTALLAVRLSIRQFHSQRWWEKKAETYSTILERLSELQFTIGEFWEDVVLGRGIGPSTGPSEEDLRLGKMHQEARVAVSKAAAMGSFIVSSEAAGVLEKLQRELQTEEGFNPADDYERWSKPSITLSQRYAQKPRRTWALGRNLGPLPKTPLGLTVGHLLAVSRMLANH